MPLYAFRFMYAPVGVRVTHIIANQPDCHICFYGLYAALNSVPAGSWCRPCIGGEYEQPLVAWSSRSRRATTTSGRDPPRQSRCPFYRNYRSRFPSVVRPSLDKYSHSNTKAVLERRLCGNSRGCLHLCTHCPIPPVWRRFFIVPQEVVLEDIRRQVAPVRHISRSAIDF